MSSSRRGREKTFSRRGIMSIPKPKKFSPVDKVAYLNRAIKRANASAGYDSAKKPVMWNFEYLVDNELTMGVVEARTKSEARALIKVKLGIGRNSRLPSFVHVEKRND